MEDMDAILKEMRFADEIGAKADARLFTDGGGCTVVWVYVKYE